MQELLSWVIPYYTPGTRDHLIFYLSGMMRKNGGFTLDDARAFIKLLCNESSYHDEDLDKSLTVVDRTYRKPLDELNGKSGLHELLVRDHETANKEEYFDRADAFSQICQIINHGSEPEPENPRGNGEDDDDSNKSNFLRGDDNNYDYNNNRLGAWLSRQKTAR